MKIFTIKRGALVLPIYDRTGKVSFVPLRVCHYEDTHNSRDCYVRKPVNYRKTTLIWHEKEYYWIARGLARSYYARMGFHAFFFDDDARDEIGYITNPNNVQASEV